MYNKPYLSQHGVKGMRWGVRNKPGEGVRGRLNRAASKTKAAAKSASQILGKIGSKTLSLVPSRKTQVEEILFGVIVGPHIADIVTAFAEEMFEDS